MGLVIFAAIFFIIYIFYLQSNKRKKESENIDNYLDDNKGKVIALFKGKDIEIPYLQDYCIYKYQPCENILKPLNIQNNPISLERVQYSGNINYTEIQKGEISGDKKFFFVDKDFQHVYVFKEFLENECLVFVTKRTSIDDYLNKRTAYPLRSCKKKYYVCG